MEIKTKEDPKPSTADNGDHPSMSSRDGNEQLSEKKHSVTLTEHQQRILDRQLDTPTVKVSYWMLFRYATKTDLAIIFISSICAIAAGVVLPLMTVVFGQLTSTFQSFFSNAGDVSAFRHEISRLALYFVYLAIGSFGAVYVTTVGFIYTGEHITQQLRERYLAAILRQNIAFFDKTGAGEITTRITADMNTIQGGISEKVGLTLTGLATFFGALVVGFIKSWKLTLILTSVIVSMFVTMGALSRFIVKFNKLSQASAASGGTLAEEVFSSIRNATALGTQDRLAKQYDSYLMEASKWGFKVKSVTGIMIGSMLFILFCDYALSFWQGSRFLVSGDISVGQIITILLAIMMGSVALGQVAPHGQAIAGAIAAGGPIFSIIDRPSSHESTSGNTLSEVKGNIELRGIKHVYPSRPEVVVMDDVDLVIPEGKVTALVGASGSGKSTVIGLIERFYAPISGQVLLDGQDIQTLDLKWLRQQMALVSQEPVLFRTSVFENIAHGLIGTRFYDSSQEKKMDLVISAAKMANAHDFISNLPEGYSTDVGERGFLMSGGQKQRIAIARAVIGDPKILLLDEATSALDTKSEGVVQAALDAASQGRTTIIIAHRLSTIKGAANIVVMSEGTIVEQGTHDELINRKGVYLELIEAQRITDGTASQHMEDDSETPMELARLPTTRTTGSEGIVRAGRVTTVKSTHDVEEGSPEAARYHYSLWTLIKFIWSFNRSEAGIMFCGLVCSIIGGSGVPLQAVYMGKNISALSLPPNQHSKLRHDVNFWSLMFFVTGIVIWMAYFVQGVAFAFCSERLIFRARAQAIRSMLRQDISFFDQPENSSGALVSMLSIDATSLAGISGATLGAILSAITTIVCALCIACGIKWKLGLVCATAMPFLVCCGFLRFWAVSQFSIRAQRAYAASAAYACEATAAIRTIASLTREDEVWEMYHSMLVIQTSKSLRSILGSSALYGCSQAGMFLASALGFWYGGTLISRGELSIEGFFICFAATTFGAQSTGGIFSYAPDMAKSKQAADALKSLVERVPDIDSWSTDGERVSSVEGAIEFSDVHFRYPTRPMQPVLRGINLKIEPGQYVALVGPSGCGKSTIVSLMERFYNPETGSILLDGGDISKLNLQDLRSRIGLVSQEPVLYSGTIKENILLGGDGETQDDVVSQACKDANIYDFIMSLPYGLDTVVGSKGVMLSGGQKQRIAIARAIIRNPKILLLDEATSALDSTSEHVVQEALDKASRGRTTIAIAHRLSTVQKADVIYVIDRGQVCESGNHEVLMQLRGKYWELVKLQDLQKKG